MSYENIGSTFGSRRQYTAEPQVMVSAIFILHWSDPEVEYSQSQVIVHRLYHKDLPDPFNVVRLFDRCYRSLRPENRTPVLYSSGISFVYIRTANDLFYLAVTDCNINAMSTVVFLEKFREVLSHYLCTLNNREEGFKEKLQEQKKLDKDILRDNSNMILELLDECMDFGIAQSTDYNILKEYIKIEVNNPQTHDNSEDSDSDLNSDNESREVKSERPKKKSKVKNIKSTHNHANMSDVLDREQTLVNSSITRTTTSAISWRQKGIFYAKNEIYIDLIEMCDFYFDLESKTILKNEIFGRCIVRSYLSGMPTCKLGFNESQISGIDFDGDVSNKSGNLLERDTQADTYVDNDDVTEEKNRRRKINIKNIQFHQCIDLDGIYKENLMTFTPPDEEFVLMTYQSEKQKHKKVLPLIMVKPQIKIQKSKHALQILCVLTTNYGRRLRARRLTVRIPVDPHLFDIEMDGNDADSAQKFKAELGEVEFKLDTSQVVWTLDNVPGSSSFKMMTVMRLKQTEHIDEGAVTNALNRKHGSQFSQDATASDEEVNELDKFYGVAGKSASSTQKLKDISKSLKHYNKVNVTFHIVQLSYSGLKINYLTVEETQIKYTCFPWIRYITDADSMSHTSTVNGPNTKFTYGFKLGKSSFAIES